MLDPHTGRTARETCVRSAFPEHPRGAGSMTRLSSRRQWNRRNTPKVAEHGFALIRRDVHALRLMLSNLNSGLSDGRTAGADRADVEPDAGPGLPARHANVKSYLFPGWSIHC